jgi:hypothetical protein
MIARHRGGIVNIASGDGAASRMLLALTSGRSDFCRDACWSLRTPALLGLMRDLTSGCRAVLGVCVRLRLRRS